MLFNLESDTGTTVSWYLVPDGYSAVPQAVICDGDRPLLQLAATDARAALVVAGRHETGLCGFLIDETMVPGLTEIGDLRIYDQESGLLVYRRPGELQIRRKVVRLETHLFPLWRLDDAIKWRFQHNARGVEAYGRETVTQLMQLNDVTSSYISGRFLFKNYAYYLDSVFEMFAIIHDPYAELAERLLVLSRVSQSGLDFLGARDSVHYEAAVEFAAELPFQDQKGLKRALKSMPSDVASTLTNPLVRQLTAATPDEMPSGGAVASALDALASFKFVGTRADSSGIKAALSEFLPVDPVDLPPFADFSLGQIVAGTLREVGAIESLLEMDLEIYHVLEEAQRRATALEVVE